MTPANFDAGMNRLRNQWPGAYGEERTNVFWNSFREVSSNVWADAVTEVLATCRAAPLLPELERAVEHARTREKEVQAARARTSGSVDDVMADAAKRSGRNEMAKACMDALEWKRANGVHNTDPKWQEVLVHLGRICGMSERQATERPRG